MTLSQSVAIRQALRTHLLGATGLPEGRALEGWPYTPSPDETWFRETLKINTARPITLGPSPYVRVFGLYLIDCYAPVSQGNAAVDALADLIVARFPVGMAALVADTEKVSIETVQRGPANREQDFVGVPVTISWHSDKTTT